MKKKSKLLILGLSIVLIIGLSSSFTVHSLEFTNKTLKHSIKVVEDYTEDVDRIIKLPTEYTYNNHPLILDLNDDGKLETVITSDRINETAPSLISLFSALTPRVKRLAKNLVKIVLDGIGVVVFLCVKTYEMPAPFTSLNPKYNKREVIPPTIGNRA